jgi:hypothetical protein
MSDKFPYCARVILAQAPFLELRLELGLASTTVSLMGLAFFGRRDRFTPT